MIRNLAAAFLILLSASLALAGGDHDRARAALARGEILPLSRILEVVEQSAGGRVIDVELEEEKGRFIYEVEVLSRGARLIKLSVDAKTGAILKRDDEDD